MPLVEDATTQAIAPVPNPALFRVVEFVADPSRPELVDQRGQVAAVEDIADGFGDSAAERPADIVGIQIVLFEKLIYGHGVIMHETMTIYTDGGCTGNPGPGGWAAVLLADGRDATEISGGDENTTNNRMELVAVIRALERVNSEFPGVRTLAVHTDSQYVQKGISQWMAGWIAKGWKTAAGKPVKNQDLWLELKALNDELPVEWHWVKGHAGNRWNERCDALVAERRREFTRS